MANQIFQPSSVAKNNSERKRRVLFGAMSGFTAGTIAALVSTFINVWLYPELPLSVNTLSAVIAWALWALFGGLLAGLAVISTDGWTSILVSAFCMTAIILIINFVTDMDSIFLNLLILLGLSLPFTAMMVPLAYVFFWLTRRFVHAETDSKRDRLQTFIVNFIVVFTLGLIPGISGKMNETAVQGVRIVHGLLQDGIHASSRAEYPVPLAKTEGYSEHKNQPYTLSQVPSVYSTVGIDVTAQYDDGYSLLCTVVLYPGNEPSVSPCKQQTP